MARVPGNRTPRRVQWASAVNEDGVTGRTRENALESDADSTHELDEAGLDVRAALVPQIPYFSLNFLSTASCVPNPYPRS